jgi:hypothetical protein
VCLSLTVAASAADLVEMKNGDRYSGEVLSLTAGELTLQNDNLGIIRLSRTNLARISFATSTPASTTTNTADALTRQIQDQGIDSVLIRQVQQQFLGAAGPEANAKFNSLVQGLVSGTTTVEDIRVEARNAVNQIRALQGDLGDETGGYLDGYLTILESFLNATDSARAPSQNARTSPPPAAISTSPPKPAAP